MTKNPCAIDADKPVAYAAKMMRDEDVGLAPIVEGQKLIGTLPDRDIAIRVVAEGKDPQTTIVRDVATTRFVTIDSDQDLDEALRLMAENQATPAGPRSGRKAHRHRRAGGRRGTCVRRADRRSGPGNLEVKAVLKR